MMADKINVWRVKRLFSAVFKNSVHISEHYTNKGHTTISVSPVASVFKTESYAVDCLAVRKHQIETILKNQNHHSTTLLHVFCKQFVILQLTDWKAILQRAIDTRIFMQKQYVSRTFICTWSFGALKTRKLLRHENTWQFPTQSYSKQMFYCYQSSIGSCTLPLIH